MQNNLKISNIKMIDVNDWDKFIVDTYGKPYCFQQQDGCKDRGVESLYVSLSEGDAYTNDSIPFEVNGDEMGVSLDAWLKMDKETVMKNLPEEDRKDYCVDLFFERNFYPHVEEIARDLCNKGLLEEGEYTIQIDW